MDGTIKVIYCNVMPRVKIISYKLYLIYGYLREQFNQFTIIRTKTKKISAKRLSKTQEFAECD